MQYPSSSPLRYQMLQNYLRGQYRRILEIRSEASRLGHYPDPEEPLTASSQESGPVASGSHHERGQQCSIDQGAPSIKAVSINTTRSAPSAQGPMRVPQESHMGLRQSPSTPTGLGSQVTHRARPKTQYSDRISPDMPSVNLANNRPSLYLNTGPGGGAPGGSAPSPQLTPNRASHYKAPSGSSSALKGRESRYFTDDFSDDELWPPASPGSGNLRPFSFAVRAGAARGEGSEGSHNRRSFFGRFGDSVTSLFAGSHGGSGSMMDMQ